MVGVKTELKIHNQTGNKMTSAEPMPVIPDPESDEVLIKMVKMILENPLCLNTTMIQLDVFLKKDDIQKEFYFLDSKTKKEWEDFEKQGGYPRRNYIKLPMRREGTQKVLDIMKAIKNKDRSNLPEILQENNLLEYSLTLVVDWENFNPFTEVRARVTSDTRKLEICYYPNSFYDDPRVRAEIGYVRVGFLTKPFIDLFQQFKKMFNQEWPDKYIILPEIADRKERSAILAELRKEPFESSKYKKIDDYL